MERFAEWTHENPAAVIAAFLLTVVPGILGIASFFGLTWSRVLKFFSLVTGFRFIKEPTFAPPSWLTGWPRGIRFTADQKWKMSKAWLDTKAFGPLWQLRLLFYRAVGLIWPFTEATLDCPEWQRGFPSDMKFTADQIRRLEGQRPAAPSKPLKLVCSCDKCGNARMQPT